MLLRRERGLDCRRLGAKIIGRSAQGRSRRGGGLGRGGRRGLGHGRAEVIGAGGGLDLGLEAPLGGGAGAGLGFLGAGLQGGVADFGPQGIDANLGGLGIRGAGLLLDHLVVINDGGFVILLLVVIFRDGHRIGVLVALEGLEVILGLGSFFAVRVGGEVILEGFLSLGGGGLVVGGAGLDEIDVTDLILGIGGLGIAGVTGDYLLICGDRVLGLSAFLKCLAGIELRERRPL